MNWLHLELKRSKVEVTTRPDMATDHFVNTIAYKMLLGILPNLQRRCRLGQRCTDYILRSQRDQMHFSSTDLPSDGLSSKTI